MTPIDTAALRKLAKGATDGRRYQSDQEETWSEFTPKDLLALCDELDAARRLIEAHETSLDIYEKVRIGLRDELDAARALAECDVCQGTPHPSGLPCVCGGTNTAQAASLYMRKERLTLQGELDAARADVLLLRAALTNLYAQEHDVFPSGTWDEAQERTIQVLADTESYEGGAG